MNLHPLIVLHDPIGCAAVGIPVAVIVFFVLIPMWLREVARSSAAHAAAEAEADQ